MISDDGTEVFGASFPELVDLVNAADLLINITGHFALSPLFAGFAVRYTSTSTRAILSSGPPQGTTVPASEDMTGISPWGRTSAARIARSPPSASPGIRRVRR